MDRVGASFGLLSSCERVLGGRIVADADCGSQDDVKPAMTDTTKILRADVAMESINKEF